MQWWEWGTEKNNNRKLTANSRILMPNPRSSGHIQLQNITYQIQDIRYHISLRNDMTQCRKETADTWWILFQSVDKSDILILGSFWIIEQFSCNDSPGMLNNISCLSLCTICYYVCLWIYSWMYSISYICLQRLKWKWWMMDWTLFVTVCSLWLYDIVWFGRDNAC